MHRKINFVKVESSIIEMSESVHWSRRCYTISFISVWKEDLMWPQGTVNQTTSMILSTYVIQKNPLVQHIGEVCRVRIEIKHMYPCFIAEINDGYSFLRTRDLIHTHRDKTRVHVLFLK